MNLAGRNWEREFASLIAHSAPELIHADKPLAGWEATIAATGINPDNLEWEPKP